MRSPASCLSHGAQSRLTARASIASSTQRIARRQSPVPGSSEFSRKGMQPPDTLIHTKLRLPSTRASLVPRPRLAEQLAAGLRLPLTLIIAPAGSGKTTLAADFARDCGIPVAWLALDKDDNQAGRFLRYVAA